jgi:hypothetical protein
LPEAVPRQLLAALLLAAVLGGCGRGPGGELERYVNRLEGALDSAAPAASDTGSLLPPRVGAVQLTVPRDSIDALDFLALRGCALQVTVGKRNSSLGRLAAPSQRLLLELEFLRLAPACSAQLRDEGRDELAATLDRAAAVKREQLPARIFNATLGSEEFRAFWRAPAVLGSYPAQTSSEPVSALAAIDALAARWLAGDYRADNEAFELLLSTVARGDGGALLAALALQQEALVRADAVLARRAAEGPLCPGGLVPGEVDVLRTVVRKFFVGGVQPWSAAVDRRRQQLLPPLKALEDRLAAVLPPAYVQWREQRDRALAAAAAPRQHVEAILDLLASCPGGPGLAPA